MRAEKHGTGAAVATRPLPFGLHGRTLKAFVIAPLGSFVIIYIGTAAYLRLARLLIAPVAWVFGAWFGLPVLYAAEFLIAMPLHRLFERRNHRSVMLYIGAGIVTSLIATWVWSEIVRAGPIPLFRDFGAAMRLTVPAGAAGGALFWRIAVRPGPEP